MGPFCWARQAGYRMTVSVGGGFVGDSAKVSNSTIGVVKLCRSWAPMWDTWRVWEGDRLLAVNDTPPFLDDTEKEWGTRRSRFLRNDDRGLFAVVVEA